MKTFFSRHLRPTAWPTPRLPPLPTSSNLRRREARSGGDPGPGSCPARQQRSKVGQKSIFFVSQKCLEKLSPGKMARIFINAMGPFLSPFGRQKTLKKLQRRLKKKPRYHHLQRRLSSNKKTEKNPTQSSTPLRPNPKPNPSPPPRAPASPGAPRPPRPPRPRPPARPPRSRPSARRGTWTCRCPWRRR